MNYYSTLPPLSPDYAGAGSVFFDYEGTILINGPSGCLANYAGYDEPRYFSKKSALLSSGFRDVRAIFGDEDFLIESLPSIEVLKNSKYLLLLSSPSAAVIGTDHSAIAQNVELELDIPVFSIETSGIYSYDVGAQKAYLALAERYLFNKSGEYGNKPAAHTNSLALIGLNPLDYWGIEQIDAIRAAFENTHEIVCTLGFGGSLEDVSKLSQVSQLIVCSISALELARKCNKEFGTDYVCGVPVGSYYSKHIDEFIAVAKKPDNEFLRPQKASHKVLIVGQQFWARSYRLALEQLDPHVDVSIASLFLCDQEYMRSQDKKLSNEGELRALIRDGFDVIIADPLIKKLVPKDLTFIEAVHMAVSSRLFANHKTAYVGAHGLDEYLGLVEEQRC